MTLKLTMAISDYAHTSALSAGQVRPVGIDLNILSYPFEQVGLRFAMGKEFDVSEFSLAGYCAHVANQGSKDMVGIPVFPSRVFRQAGFFVHGDSEIKDIADLKGKRVGLPQWSQTATVYARGYMVHQGGVALHDVDWVQAGVNAPGRKEGVDIKLPDGVQLTVDPQHSLSELLANGELDAVISARAPNSFVTGHPKVQRLFSNPRAVEERYFAESGIFPIMHVMVVRRDVYETNRWVLKNLMDAFELAKENCFDRMREGTTSYLPLPWGPQVMEELHAQVFPNGDIWPYGALANRATLDPFLLYCYEQGVTHRHLKLEELFPAECYQEVVV